jgi:hypothetical protein
MNKIREILTAWATAFNPTIEEKIVAHKRLLVCMRCPYWQTNMLNQKYCGQCGCLTQGKVFTPIGQQGCPMGYWTI